MIDKPLLNAVFVLAVLIAVGSFALHVPLPESQPANAAPTLFSADRALTHLNQLAQAPRNPGSTGHQKAGDYLLTTLRELGLEPQIQEALQSAGKHQVNMVNVKNILVKIDGADPSFQILFATHYDTVANSNGASANGAAVASALETIRALKAGPTPKNTLYFLFTDSTAVNHLGAAAFVSQHPVAKELDLIVNLEAIGTGGPVYVTHTSKGNGNLISAYAKAVSLPVATSLQDTLAQISPHITDFNTFQALDDVQILELVHLEGPPVFRTTLDQIRPLSPETLQHQGDTILGLAHHFGDFGLKPANNNATYFTLRGLGLIQYPVWLAYPLLLLLTVLMFVAYSKASRAEKLTIKGMLGSALAFPIMVAVSILILTLAATWLSRTQSPSLLSPPDSNIVFFYMAACFLAFWVTDVFGWLGKRTAPENVGMGAFFWCFLTTIVLTIKAPESSYLLALPLALTLIGFTLGITKKDETDLVGTTVHLVFGIPAILILVTALPLLYYAFPFSLITVPCMAVLFLLSLFAAPLARAHALDNRLVPPLFLVLALIFFGASRTQNKDGSIDNPQIDSLAYALDADTNQSWWVSTNWQGPGSWTQKYFPKTTQYAPAPDLFPNLYRKVLKSQAPHQDYPAPSITLENDQTDFGLRRLTLRLQSNRDAANVALYFPDPPAIEAMSLAGIELPKECEVVRVYRPDPQGVLLKITYPADQTLTVRLIDATHGLPPELAKRPPKTAPDPDTPWYQDVVLVKKNAVFAPTAPIETSAPTNNTNPTETPTQASPTTEPNQDPATPPQQNQEPATPEEENKTPSESPEQDSQTEPKAVPKVEEPPNAAQSDVEEADPDPGKSSQP